MRVQKTLKLAIAVISLTALSGSSALAEGDDEFEGGSPELNQPRPRFSPEEIQIEINKSIQFACKGDRCVMASVTSTGERFTVQMSMGFGSSSGVAGGQGGVVIVNGQPQTQPMQPSIGLTLKYTRMNCTQKVNVPRSLYIALNTYLYGLINEDGSTRRSFSPADQTMILFYTTILNQAKGCTTGE